MGKTERYHKLFISLRYWLLGMSEQNQDWRMPLNALEYAKNIHTGLRKDGATPEFQHQLEIAHYLRTLYKGLLFPAQTIAAALLHDVPEDYDVSYQEISTLCGSMVAEDVELLTKKHMGTTKNLETYFLKMATSPRASIIKGADRINNHQTMHGAFTPEKQASYLHETKQFILPMIKNARRLHPEQEQIYENVKFILNSQIELISIRLDNNKAQTDKPNTKNRPN